MIVPRVAPGTRPLIASLLALALAACGHAPAPTTAAPAAPSGAADSLAPFPYTIDQLRAGCAPGTVIKYRMLDGGKVVLNETHFIASPGPDTARLEVAITDEHGAALGPVQHLDIPWAELQKHAAFPAAATSVEDAELDVPAGHFATRKYIVRRPGDDGRPSVAIFYFDKARGGPPLKLLVEVGGAVVQELTRLPSGAAAATPGAPE